MPAETHQRHDPVDTSAVLELLASVLDLDLDDDRAAAVTLAAVGVDDDLGLYSLWAAVTAELAERTVGEIDLDDVRVGTLGELAATFAEALGQPPPTDRGRAGATPGRRCSPPPAPRRRA